MDEFVVDGADVLRIDLPLDEELVETLIWCAERHPSLSFAELVRALLLRESGELEPCDCLTHPLH